MLLLFLLALLLMPSALGHQEQVDHSALVEILRQCWRHSPVIVMDPMSMSDELLNKMASGNGILDGGDVAFFQASDATTLGELVSVASRRGVQFLLVFNVQAMAQATFEQQSHEEIFSKMTWVFPSSLESHFNEARLDDKLLFFSGDMKDLTITERFGFKSKDFNKIGWMNSNQSIQCASVLSLDERRSEHLKNKTLHFASATPYLVDPEGVQEAQRKGITISGTGMVSRELLYDVAAHTSLNLRETSLYDTKFHEGTNSVWDSAIDMLEGDKTIDLIGDYLGMTIERKERVDFTSVLMSVKVPFYVQAKERNALNLNSYFKIFSCPLWISIILLLACTALTLTIIDGFCHLTEHHPRSGWQFFLEFCHWLWKLLLQLVQRNTIELPHCFGPTFKGSLCIFAKSMLLFITSCLSYILFSIYASNLTSVLSAPPSTESPIKSPQDLLLPNVELGLGDPFALSLFVEARENSSWREVFLQKVAKEDVEFLSTTEEIRDFLLSHENAVYTGVLEPENVQMLRSFGSEILASPSRRIDGAFAVPKNSQIRSMVSFHVRKLSETGTTRRRMESFSRNALDSSQKRVNEKKGHGTISISHVIFPFLVVLLGLILSPVLACLEKAVSI